MSQITYATNTDGDWEALYIDGRLADLEQNHSLNVNGVLDALIGHTVTSVACIEADMKEGMASWLGDQGFPEKLSDIPKEARR